MPPTLLTLFNLMGFGAIFLLDIMTWIFQRELLNLMRTVIAVNSLNNLNIHKHIHVAQSIHVLIKKWIENNAILQTYVEYLVTCCCRPLMWCFCDSLL